MNEQNENLADVARSARVDELRIEHRRLEFDAHRYATNAAHHLEQYQAERDTAAAKRAKAAVIAEEIHRLEHPAAGVDLTTELDDNMHRALQGGPRP